MASTQVRSGADIFGGGARAQDRDSSGRLWTVVGTTGDELELWYSDDDGATFEQAAAVVALGRGYNDSPRSFFIDDDDHAHLIASDAVSSTIGLSYLRMPDISPAGAWSAPTPITTSTSHGAADLVAHPLGSGWVAHVVYSTTNRTFYRRLDITAGGSVTVGSEVSVDGSNAAADVSIDFRHTGNGKTPTATPDIYIGWSLPLVAVFMRRGAYSAGSWTLGTARTIGSGSIVEYAGLFDGTRFLMAWAVSATVSMAERDAADTTTTSRTPPALSDGTALRLSISYDGQGNTYIAASGSTSQDPYLVKFDRAAGTFGDWESLDPDVVNIQSGKLALERGYGASIGAVWAGSPVGGGSVEVRFISAVELNRPPHAPTITSPTPGQAWARNEPNRVGIGFNDPDPGDSQSGNGGAVRLAGEIEPYYTWDGETPNEWHDIPADELLAGNNELHAWSYDSQGEAGPPSDWVPFTVADRPGAPSITDPINGATIPTQTYPVVISAAQLEAARYRRYADVDGTIDPETVYQDVTVESATSRQRTLDFPENQRWEWIGVIRKRDGLWSADEALSRNFVSWTAPAAPTVTVGIHQDVVDGRMMPVGFAVTATHPTPVGEEPAVTHVDVWRALDDGTGQPVPGTEEQLQRGTALAPSATFIDPSVRSGVPYLYRVRAWGTNGVYTDAPWAG